MSFDSSNMTRRTACKSVLFSAMAVGAGELFEQSGAEAAQTHLPRISPAEAGIDPAAIAAFVAGVDEKVGGLHSFMLLRHGKVAAEAWWAPYGPKDPHMLYSLSKSFTSTAVGLAISEGKFTVDSPVISFFPDSLPAEQSEHLKAMQVRHLLTMSTGHDQDATGPTTAAADGDWVKAFLALPLQHAPGTHFVYNSAATYMLSAIVQKVTGQKVVDYLKPRLFAPLGIADPMWETCPKGINCGGWGLNVKTEDIARFGQLYLQKGKWAGHQVLPEAWVQEATTRKIANGDPAAASDWSQGYCYQFWRCRHDAFRGDGAFGQFCVVMPELDVVLAITSGVGDMQAILDVAWNRLLPGISQQPAPAEAEKNLADVLAKCEVTPPVGQRDSATAKRVSGKTYKLDVNPLKLQSVAVKFDGDHTMVSLVTESGSYTIKGGANSWVKGTGDWARGTGALPGLVSNKAAGRGAWSSDDTYELKLCYYETPFIETLTFKFDGNSVSLSARTNVGFGPTQRQAVTGHTV